MGFSFGDIGKVAGGGALFGMVGQPAMELGSGMIAGKYAADLQGHQLDRQNQYNRDQALEMFNKQVAENNRVWEKNWAAEQQTYAANVARSDQVWEREKQYNQEMWDKQNQYNSPAAQMQRLKEAGLNPALMYTQGNVGNATAVSIAKQDPVSAEAPYMTAADARYTPSGAVDSGSYLMEGLANYNRIRQTSLQTQHMAFQNANLYEQTRALKRENDILEKSGGSTGDPKSVRAVSRLWQYMKDINPGIFNRRKYQTSADVDPVPMQNITIQIKGKKGREE